MPAIIEMHIQCKCINIFDTSQVHPTLPGRSVINIYPAVTAEVMGYIPVTKLVGL